MTLSDHFLTASSTTFEVRISAGALDRLILSFTEYLWNDVVILDAAYVEDDENRRIISDIIGVPADTEYPSTGYLVFYN